MVCGNNTISNSLPSLPLLLSLRRYTCTCVVDWSPLVSLSSQEKVHKGGAWFERQVQAAGSSDGRWRVREVHWLPQERETAETESKGTLEISQEWYHKNGRSVLKRKFLSDGVFHCFCVYMYIQMYMVIQSVQFCANPWYIYLYSSCITSSADHSFTIALHTHTRAHAIRYH